MAVARVVSCSRRMADAGLGGVEKECPPESLMDRGGHRGFDDVALSAQEDHDQHEGHRGNRQRPNEILHEI